MLGKQYDGYEPLPGLHVNGKLTLGENIADLAGLVIAHKAYQIALDGKPAPVLDGYHGRPALLPRLWPELARNLDATALHPPHRAFQPAQPVEIPRQRRRAQRRRLVCGVRRETWRRAVSPTRPTREALVGDVSGIFNAEDAQRTLRSAVHCCATSSRSKVCLARKARRKLQLSRYAPINRSPPRPLRVLRVKKATSITVTNMDR